MDPRTAFDSDSLKRHVSELSGASVSEIRSVRVLRRSIDARQSRVWVNLSVEAYINEDAPAPDFENVAVYGDVSSAPSAVIVGAGPAGLFAALRLIELGIKPIVVERGRDVTERKRDLARLSREGVVDGDSNYCFGEGGAGAYSDGKLFTRSKKRGDNGRILRLLCQNGADPSILIDAHPHIGTDRLPAVIKNIRERIISHGGEVHFSTRCCGFKIAGGRVCGIFCADGREFDGPVILATGHSARDVYRLLADSGFVLQPKGIAVGVRLEHPQELIDKIRYHSKDGRGKYLPPAEYCYTARAGGRGVYSFCMCPGGYIVPSATEPGQVVVNGMSASARSSRWANSGMVVELLPEDLPGEDVFRVLNFQLEMERAAFAAGGGGQTAPAQRMTDYMDGRLSQSLPETSYVPGLKSCLMSEVLPAFIDERLREGLSRISASARGFLTSEACLIGVETRTSSPMRIVRSADDFQQEAIKGLFPAGEGAGYAGGIVSAAIDGERCAEALRASLSY